MQALVELLLTFSQALSSNILSSEMANHRINHYELDVFFWASERQDSKQLFNDLKNYDGVFKHKNLLLFNDWQYGTFVYDINNPDRTDYVEHLTINAMTLESLTKIINKLTK